MVQFDYSVMDYAQLCAVYDEYYLNIKRSLDPLLDAGSDFDEFIKIVIEISLRGGR
jgi:hypothetical protein